jgi:site-specific DNA-methyltransferase (adenine-specific)
MSESIFEVQIINKEYTDAEWTTFEGKLPEGVYILRAQDINGKWFDRKARFERAKGWSEATAEEWANKRRPFQVAGPAQQNAISLDKALKTMPQLSAEEIEERKKEELRRFREKAKPKFSLEKVFGVKIEEREVILPQRLDPSEVKLNHIYNGDCIAVMETLPSNYAHVCITDPPYNLGKRYKSGIDDKLRAKDYYEWSYRWIDEAIRILKPNGQLFIALWDTYKYHIKTYIDERWGHKMRFIEEIAWETTGVPRPGSGKLRGDITPWLHFGPARQRGQPAINYTHNVDNIRSWKFVKHTDVVKKNARYIHPLGKDPGTLMRFFDKSDEGTAEYTNYYVLNWMRKMIEYLCDFDPERAIEWLDAPSNVISKRNLPATHKDRLDHPCQMPIEVPMVLVELSTNPGDIVLEPFMGTGTTAAAAMLKGRNAIGIELSPDYTLMALERLQRKTLRTKAAIEYWDGQTPLWTSDPCTPQFKEPGQKPLLDFFAIGAAGAQRLGDDLVQDIVREIQTGNFEL